MEKMEKKFRFAMNQEKQDICREIAASLPEWNCGRGLLQDFVDCFERRKEVNLQMGESIDPPFRSTMPYVISKQQIEFFLSKDAENAFMEHTDLLVEIRTAIAANKKRKPV